MPGRQQQHGARRGQDRRARHGRGRVARHAEHGDPGRDARDGRPVQGQGSARGHRGRALGANQSRGLPGARAASPRRSHTPVTRMPAPHVLVTGFEPFAGDTANPSQELAKTMDGRAVGPHAVRSLVLPVEHEATGEIMRAPLDAPGLTAVIHLGLAAGRARLSLERIAVNVMDYRIPDARGALRQDEACAADGPAAYASTLPLRAILQELTGEGIPAHLSYTAGTYLCNYTLYTTLHALAVSGRAIPAGFIHLPLSPAMVAARGLEEPSMDLGIMLRALEIVLRSCPAEVSPPSVRRRGSILGQTEHALPEDIAQDL